MTSARRDITAEQVDLLIREGEGLMVEFKERFSSRIAKDIVAWRARRNRIYIGQTRHRRPWETDRKRAHSAQAKRRGNKL